MRPLVPEFNRVILELAPLHVAQPLAPATFGEVMALERGRPLPVWDGASERTIYADARVNHAFRAWHDAAHMAVSGVFTLEGERAVCEQQKRDVLARYPSAPKLWLALLDAEILGQADYYQRTGAFPVNQYAFVSDALTLAQKR